MSSTPGRDPDSNGSKDSSENPFIRFRRFADAQIGSLLQGIIGLPSAWTKSPQTRWADFDEDMRRRDEQQARQKDLRDSEARKAGEQIAEEEVAIPVKKSPAWERPSAQGKIQAAQRNNSEAEDPLEKDVPLYAPVTKALFAPHGQLKGNDGEWDEVQPPTWEVLSENSMRQSAHTRSSTDSIGILRNLTYNDLNTSPLLRSNYSLLPYLLFSSYSPLKLSSTMPYGSHYCDAFEDLILISHGRPMLSDFDRIFGRRNLLAVERLSVFYINPNTSLALQHMAWLRKLHSSHVLQQSETLAGSKALLTRAWQSLYHPVWPPATSSMETSQEEDAETNEEPQNEQDMYDRFLNWASLPIAFEKAIDSLSRGTEEFIEHQLKALQEHNRKIDSESSSQTSQPTEDPTNTNSSSPKPLPSLPQILQRVLSILDPVPDARPSSDSRSAEHQNADLSEEDDVVSTTTTSERTTNEDGSVRTSVTVVKRFADGRESVTRTTCVGGSKRGWNGRDEEGEWEEEEREQEVGGREVRKKEKGWFWS